MKLSTLRNSSARTPMGVRISLLSAALACLLTPNAALLHGQEAELQSTAPSRLLGPIDDHIVVSLKNNVRKDVSMAPDLGPVEDSRAMHLYLLLQRTPQQQADLDNLVMRQQQPTAAEYHKWLTPKQFGARFGASQDDIAKVTQWLGSRGFEVRSVLNNASMIDFVATAGQVRESFHTQLHYVNLRGGKYPALVSDPQIPAALAPLVAGIKGLNKIPALMNHTTPRMGGVDENTHRWKVTSSPETEALSPSYTDGGGDYFVTPQDLYTIYNVNPVLTANELAAKATVAVIEESDIEFGTVNSSTHVATGGDVATFRNVFGVPGTLNLHVYHGYGSVTCTAPGIDPNGNGEDVEASLDAEWINATAPSANVIFMSCDSTTDNGVFSSEAALIDGNLSDVMSLSYGESELYYTSSSDYTAQDTLYAQAATQGQTFFVSAGDSGSDVKDQNTSGTAISGINVSAFGSPLTTVAGGTDFQDYFDAGEGGPAQSNYWSATNSAKFGDALSYVPETAWNASCASSLIASFEGYSNAGFCGANAGFTSGSVVGGSGGISTHYSVPAWQTGISGYSNSMHSQPDISGFASDGPWGHALIFCDSHTGSTCAGTSTFGVAGGTSFVAPYMAGVAGLLVDSTGSRQGVLNPALYALGKAQYTAAATKTACYANGQTANAGVTTGLPAASCIFNDVTTSNNDVPCQSGSTKCYVDSGATYGMLSLTGSNSLSVAYASAPGFDQVTGIGSVNVANLLSKWNTAFTSSTALSANPTSIASTASTTLKATVTTGTPTGYVDTKPATTGTATFKDGTTVIGSCTLSGGSCSSTIQGSALSTGANSITATYAGSGTYPSSTSSVVTVTVTGSTTAPATMSTPTPGSTLTGSSATFTWTTGTGVTAYLIHVGTTGAGSSNIESSATLHTTSLAVSGIPTSGAALNVRLYSYINSAWQYNDYTYTESGSTTPAPAVMSAPVPGSTLTGATATFTWTTGTGVTAYLIHVGTTGAGSSNIYSSSTLHTTNATVSGIPASGATLNVRLYSYINSAWQYNDYTYTESGSTTPALAVMSTPTPGSTLTGSSATFTWTTGTGVTAYLVHVGTTGAGSSNIESSATLHTTSLAVTGIPTTGATLNVRLYSYINSAWQYNDYTYKEY